MSDRITDIRDLHIGRWYVLVLSEYDDESIDLNHAPLAEYMYESTFVDEDGRAFNAADFDYFIEQQ